MRTFLSALGKTFVRICINDSQCHSDNSRDISFLCVQKSLPFVSVAACRLFFQAAGSLFNIEHGPPGSPDGDRLSFPLFFFFFHNSHLSSIVSTVNFHFPPISSLSLPLSLSLVFSLFCLNPLFYLIASDVNVGETFVLLFPFYLELLRSRVRPERSRAEKNRLVD